MLVVGEQEPGTVTARIRGAPFAMALDRYMFLLRTRLVADAEGTELGTVMDKIRPARRVVAPELCRLLGYLDTELRYMIIFLESYSW